MPVFDRPRLETAFGPSGEWTILIGPHGIVTKMKSARHALS